MGHRRLLDRLSVFEGGIDLAAAEAVCGPTSELGMDVVDGLVSLADQSLIRSRGDGRRSPVPYARHDPRVRRPRGSRRGERRRWWPLATAPGSSSSRSGSRLTSQAPSSAACSTSSSSSTTTSGPCSTARRPRAMREMAIGLAFAVWRFWQKRGHLSRGPAPPRRDGRGALVAERPGAPGAAPGGARRACAGGRPTSRRCGVAYTEAVEIWRSLGDRSELANALYNYSFVFSVPEDPADAGTGDLDPTARAIGTSTRRWPSTASSGIAVARATCSGGWATRSTSATRDDAGVTSSRPRSRPSGEVGDRTMEAWALHMVGGALLRIGRPRRSEAVPPPRPAPLLRRRRCRRA